jgi:hypothetical protein
MRELPYSETFIMTTFVLVKPNSLEGLQLCLFAHTPTVGWINEHYFVCMDLAVASVWELVVVMNKNMKLTRFGHQTRQLSDLTLVTGDDDGKG